MISTADLVRADGNVFDSGPAQLLAGYYVDRWYGTNAWCSLPWPERMEDLPASIGPQIIGWAEWRTYDETGVPGLIHHLTGERWRFTPGQRRFLHLWYAYTPDDGRYLYRSGLRRGAKGTGKDPFGGALCNIELIGPSWLVKRDGRWMGVTHRMPLVQIASNSESQSKDVLRVANGMLCRETVRYFGISAGETRTLAREIGGRTEILTSSEMTNEGDPATFIFMNESHHMKAHNGGHLMAKVARRNVGKSPIDIQARLVEATNAHVSGEDSVAEQTYLAWRAQVTDQTELKDILYDTIEARPDVDLYDRESRRAGLRAAYADAPWTDLQRKEAEVLDLRTPPGDSVRYYMNGLGDRQDAWVSSIKFDALARPSIVVEKHQQVAIFLDCSKSEDSTALMGCRLEDGFCFVLGCWERPPGRRGEGWLAPRDEVEAVIRDSFAYFKVEWLGADPSPARDDEDDNLYWMDMLDRLHRDYHRRLAVWATGGAKIGHSVLFDMRIKTYGGIERNKLFTAAAMQCRKDINEFGALIHDGSERLKRHVHDARRRTNPWGTTLGKVSRDSKQHIDLAVAMVGARMGRRVALNSGRVRIRTGKAGF